ncbi:MAG: hypothetical protein ABSG98_05960 [Anaerolineales bacterium]
MTNGVTEHLHNPSHNSKPGRHVHPLHILKERLRLEALIAAIANPMR